MNPTHKLAKTILSTSIAAVLTLTSAMALAETNNDSKLRTYTDPVTGELRVAPKLLSQMTEAEKAALTQEEINNLEEIEAQINKEKPQSLE